MQECNPTGYTEDYEFSNCFKWSESDAVQLLTAHVSGISADSLGVDPASFLPADVGKVQTTFNPEPQNSKP